MDQIVFSLFFSETIKQVQQLLMNYCIVRFNKLLLYKSKIGADLNGS